VGDEFASPAESYEQNKEGAIRHQECAIEGVDLSAE
jgi:hypothetical protein